MFYITRVDIESRKRLKQADPQHFKSITEVLNTIDPVGLAFIADEYDLEVADILVNLPNCHSASDVKNLVFEVFSRWFSAEIAKPILEKDMVHFEFLLALKNK